MPAQYSKLIIYAIRDKIAGAPVTTYDQVLNPDKDVTEYGPVDLGEFSAKLFVNSSGDRRPPWAAYLESGFGDIDEILASDTFSALLVLKVKYRRPIFFALSFGYSGRFLLRRDAFKRAYGLRTALNLLYPASLAVTSTDYAPIRSITARTVSANTLHTLRQTDRSASFEQFGVDIQRDLLGAVTGIPHDKKHWGPTVSGSDALYLAVPTPFTELGAKCREAETASRRKDYRSRFSWIDNVVAIEDPVLQQALWATLLDHLRAKTAEDLELVVPAIVDWNAIDRFLVTSANIDAPSISIDAYLDGLDSKGRLPKLTIDDLRGPNRLVILDGNANIIDEWPLSECLSGQLTYRGKTYLVSGGEFFSVNADYLDELDRMIGEIPESARQLPPAPESTPETAYITMARDASQDLLLLHTATINLDNRTTPIEICDLLSNRGEFIHVKRKLGSSSLSHLFSQGYVSAELLVANSQFRQMASARISDTEEARAAELGLHGAPRTFSNIIQDPFLASQAEIVYAIHAPWAGRSLSQALPFFSKVNLRRHSEDLKRMGYRVSHLRIQTE